MKKSNQNKWIVMGLVVLALVVCANIVMTVAIMNSTQQRDESIAEDVMHLQRELIEKGVIGHQLIDN